MGTYINFGLNCVSRIYKKKLSCDINNKESITDIMSKKIDVDCYNFIEHEDYYEFKVKDEMFNSEDLKGFLIEQYGFLDLDEEKKKVILNDIDMKILDSYDKVVDFFDSKSYPNFQHYNNIDFVRVNFYDITVHSEGILFFYAGKAYIECYGDLFQYMNKLILKNSSYDIAKLIHIFLDL